MTQDLQPAPADISALLDAEMPTPKEGMPAAFFLSMPKCGSTMLTKAVEIIANEMELPAFHFSRFFWPHGISKGQWFRYDLRDCVRDRIIYFGFRDLPDFIAASETFQTRRSVFLVRDPRDVAVSHYFSKLHEHPAPLGPAGDRYRKERARMAEEGIDSYVVRYAPTYLKNWQIYMRNLPLASGHARVFRYEDIVFNKYVFLSAAFEFLGLPLSEDALDQAIKKVDVFPDAERVNRRARQVKPGDHREKLRPDTIDTLDELLAEPLKHHDYT